MTKRKTIKQKRKAYLAKIVNLPITPIKQFTKIVIDGNVKIKGTLKIGADYELVINGSLEFLDDNFVDGLMKMAP